ncbi:MAG TPA: hypothetical protein VMQ83_03285 [Gammaproteobacteria bacterium]|nr:hypothetical protein [Gammaproteobacteria bacterium]
MRINLLLIAASAVCLAGGVFAAEHSRDAVLIDPDSHVVVLENEHVRVLENLSSPGKRSPMHTHGTMLIISLDHARLKMTVPDGDPFIIDLHPGQVMWMDDPEHAWEVLAGQLHVIAVEVKAAAKD